MMGGVVEMIARGVVAFISARMLSYTGVCASNNAAWMGAAIFLWLCYHFIIKNMESAKQCHLVNHALCAIFHLGTLSLREKAADTKDFPAFSLEKSKYRRFSRALHWNFAQGAS